MWGRPNCVLEQGVGAAIGPAGRPFLRRREAIRPAIRRSGFGPSVFPDDRRGGRGGRLGAGIDNRRASAGLSGWIRAWTGLLALGRHRVQFHRSRCSWSPKQIPANRGFGFLGKRYVSPLLRLWYLDFQIKWGLASMAGSGTGFAATQNGMTLAPRPPNARRPNRPRADALGQQISRFPDGNDECQHAASRTKALVGFLDSAFCWERNATMSRLGNRRSFGAMQKRASHGRRKQFARRLEMECLEDRRLRPPCR